MEQECRRKQPVNGAVRPGGLGFKLPFSNPSRAPKDSIVSLSRTASSHITLPSPRTDRIERSRTVVSRPATLSSASRFSLTPQSYVHRANFELTLRKAQALWPKVTDEDVLEALDNDFAAGDALKAIALLVAYSDAAACVLNPVREPTGEISPLRGACNYKGMCCYIDSLMFALFARVRCFEPLLYYQANSLDTEYFATWLRLYVNLIRRGELITSDINRCLHAASVKSGWSGVKGQQDAAEFYVFLMETLHMPMLSLKVELIHAGREDAHGDHKVTQERLLYLPIPGYPKDPPISLEECLSQYFSNSIVVNRNFESLSASNSDYSLQSYSTDSVQPRSSFSYEPDLGQIHVYESDAEGSTAAAAAAYALTTSEMPVVTTKVAKSSKRDRHQAKLNVSSNAEAVIAHDEIVMGQNANCGSSQSDLSVDAVIDENKAKHAVAAAASFPEKKSHGSIFLTKANNLLRAKRTHIPISNATLSLLNDDSNREGSRPLMQDTKPIETVELSGICKAQIKNYYSATRMYKDAGSFHNGFTWIPSRKKQNFKSECANKLQGESQAYTYDSSARDTKSFSHMASQEVQVPAWMFLQILPFYAEAREASIGLAKPEDDRVAQHFSNARPIIGLCLKRYFVNKDGKPARNDREVIIPEVINFPSFVADDSGNRQFYGNFRMELESAVLHRGSDMHAGHYVSLVSEVRADKSRRWLLCDDMAAQGRKATEVDFESAFTRQTPYLLFYQLVETDIPIKTILHSRATSRDHTTPEATHQAVVEQQAEPHDFEDHFSEPYPPIDKTSVVANANPLLHEDVTSFSQLETHNGHTGRSRGAFAQGSNFSDERTVSPLSNFSSENFVSHDTQHHVSLPNKSSLHDKARVGSEESEEYLNHISSPTVSGGVPGAEICFSRTERDMTSNVVTRSSPRNCEVQFSSREAYNVESAKQDCADHLESFTAAAAAGTAFKNFVGNTNGQMLSILNGKKEMISNQQKMKSSSSPPQSSPSKVSEKSRLSDPRLGWPHKLSPSPFDDKSPRHMAGPTVPRSSAGGGRTSPQDNRRASWAPLRSIVSEFGHSRKAQNGFSKFGSSALEQPHPIAEATTQPVSKQSSSKRSTKTEKLRRSAKRERSSGRSSRKCLIM